MAKQTQQLCPCFDIDCIKLEVCCRKESIIAEFKLAKKSGDSSRQSEMMSRYKEVFGKEAAFLLGMDEVAQACAENIPSRISSAYSSGAGAIINYKRIEAEI